MSQKRPAADSTAAQLHTHEAICAERYGKIIETMGDLTKRIGRIEGWAAVAAGSLLLGMAGIILTLILKLSGH